MNIAYVLVVTLLTPNGQHREPPVNFGYFDNLQKCQVVKEFLEVGFPSAVIKCWELVPNTLFPNTFVAPQ